ncbi:MAG: hypothetical protein ACRDDZ_13360 [Marinifilaceae bacterium]
MTKAIASFMSTFYTDLAKAKTYEEKVATKYRELGWTVTKAPDKYFHTQKNTL